MFRFLRHQTAMASQATQTFQVQSASQHSSLDFGVVVASVLSVIAVFAPIKEMVLALLFLVAIDFVTGIIAALVRKNQITSRRMSRTISKTFVYLLTVGVVFIANKFLLGTSGTQIPLDTVIVSFIALTELKSIFENLHKIHRQPIFQFLIDKLSSNTAEVLDAISDAIDETKEATKPQPKEKKRGTTKRQK